ncbi:MAG: low affinity iron permease family protein [Oligoflexus sp.]|nr:low affinity iron permease family protein [Oligoflexus sp.]
MIGKFDKLFTKLASKTAIGMGKPAAFLIALSVVVIWAVSGPLFHYSDTWELVINTATTIVTFLMVFLIQNTQNRESRALHLKLDELILSLKHADNKMIDIENLEEAELEELARKYHNLNQTAQVTIERHLSKRHHHANRKDQR